MQIAGLQKREYITVLLFVLHDIHRNFAKLNVIEKIGLPDNQVLTVNYDYLLRLAQMGQTDYFPPKIHKKLIKSKRC
jgi:hypothetical protein